MKNSYILVVDDEHNLCRAIEISLMGEGYEIKALHTCEDALQAISEREPDLLLTDLRLPDGDGMQILQTLKETWPNSQAIVMTAYATVDTALGAMRQGAFDYVLKPFNPIELKNLIANALEIRWLRNENDRLRQAVDSAADFSDLIGRSEAMNRVFDMVKRVAMVDTTALITGESGTGKEMIARAIHSQSGRRKGPFIAINCGALPETLLESELFGHARGSFTGADRARDGIFASASGGTVFLDEIGEASSSVQVNLLRVLQESEIRRVGDSSSTKVDVRIIAATNRNLEEMVKSGGFREDLFYRLDVVRLHLPPLRERQEDIIALGEHFLGKYIATTGLESKPFTDEARRALMAYQWPGNIRELENVVKKAIIFSTGSAIDLAALPQNVSNAIRSGASQTTLSGGGGSGFFLDSSVADPNGMSDRDLPDELAELSFKDAKSRVISAFERSYISTILRFCDGVVTSAAAMAGMDRGNFQKLMRKNGIKSTLFREM
ncbi:MAG: hypothetical protein CVV64_01950 [Candidatus Wallbacteria bacterium HGW-Wallbacteria-1]|jgi:DNA-binding NtrC family response regulator|uniref:Fis family transcriptional regulator n=1 Tax=Candidatus Wallbacteria bacterium HGW-Wallbacteria-1 TaxID=2013854 RepID=A0A2N1PV24_9BACT|nr:MAG: hypothetical protein CVV64_01950 [Candidatus Wallbacteria bacterium HGW-Wallbacteria-1]